MEKLECSTCKMNVFARKNFVRFKCPKCAETEIIRCSTCKNLGLKYTCPKCNFEGP